MYEIPLHKCPRLFVKLNLYENSRLQRLKDNEDVQDSITLNDILWMYINRNAASCSIIHSELQQFNSGGPVLRRGS
jgi:hypothetical protein